MVLEILIQLFISTISSDSVKQENMSQEYYNNFGDNSQNATNFADFVNGTVRGPLENLSHNH